RETRRQVQNGKEQRQGAFTSETSVNARCPCCPAHCVPYPAMQSMRVEIVRTPCVCRSRQCNRSAEGPGLAGRVCPRHHVCVDPANATDGGLKIPVGTSRCQSR